MGAQMRLYLLLFSVIRDMTRIWGYLRSVSHAQGTVSQTLDCPCKTCVPIYDGSLKHRQGSITRVLRQTQKFINMLTTAQTRLGGYLSHTHGFS